MINSFKKFKRSGTYRRKVKKNRDAMLKTASEVNNLICERTVSYDQLNLSDFNQNPSVQTEDFIVHDSTTNDANESRTTRDINLDTQAKADGICNKNYINSDAPSYGDESAMERTRKLQNHLREWAIEHQITHTALKDLMSIINSDIEKVLPEDPRTLLRTPQEIVTSQIVNGGSYWHHGLEKCLQCIFRDIKESVTISLNINMDGLPIFNSSKVEFWPILFTINERPELPAMVIGIYCGTTKCSDLEAFLTPFVNEMKKAMSNGVCINSHKVTVRLRCIICDSPARAYIKGVANFNAHQGCLKCTTIGEYNYISNTNIFPRTVCEKRTDVKFRQKLYGAHHKNDSPLLKLDIDMVEQFPVSDPLHLLHLGLMKRFLFGWRDGTFRLSNTKWPARTTNEVTSYLRECKMPAEFHRTVRGLDCLAHWKGTEYRTFLHYIGIVALKDHLTNEAYVHFLLLFCAITICTSKQYLNLLLQFIEIFAELYGEHHLTSNVHNLSHIVDEVERFGVLDSLSAYPFENALGKIKRLLRNGNLPLPQVAKRIVEDFNCTMDSSCASYPGQSNEEPILSKRNDGENVPNSIKTQECSFYSKIQLKEFCIGTDLANCWCLTYDNQIFWVTNIMSEKITSKVKLCCLEIAEKVNFFILPIESKRLNIYCVDRFDDKKNRETKTIEIAQIKCKMVRMTYHAMQVFIPLLHTIHS